MGKYDCGIRLADGRGYIGYYRSDSIPIRDLSRVFIDFDFDLDGEGVGSGYYQTSELEYYDAYTGDWLPAYMEKEGYEVKINSFTCSEPDPITTNERGGSQSKVEYACHLLPPVAALEVSKVLETGRVKYGAENWRLIDEADHINHALGHLFQYLAGDNSGEDHLAHAATRLLFALEINRVDNNG